MYMYNILTRPSLVFCSHIVQRHLQEAGGEVSPGHLTGSREGGPGGGGRGEEAPPVLHCVIGSRGNDPVYC